MKRNAFSPLLVRDTLKATFKKREGPNRKYLLVLIAVTVFHYVPFYGEWVNYYNYVRTRYGWEVEEYSFYKTVDSLTSLAGIQTCPFKLCIQVAYIQMYF